MYDPLGKRIVVDGNDGTGKTTLCRNLRLLGFQNVHDRGEMTEATDDPSVSPMPDTTYILLVCDPAVSYSRVKDIPDPYHTKEALTHYDKRFRELAEPFSAHVIDDSGFKHVQLALQAIMPSDRPYRFGAPTGRLKKWLHTIDEDDLLQSIIGLRWEDDRQHRTERPGRTVYFLRTRTYPQLVAYGALDMAVCGDDVLRGSPWLDSFEIVAQKPQGQAHYALASTTGKLPDRNILRIATSCPWLAQEYFCRLPRPHLIIDAPGSIEGFVPDLADVALDIVESGDTLTANGLREIENLGPLNICIIRRKVHS